VEPWILIVDDEELIRDGLRAYLEDEGMRVVALESAEEALEYVKGGQTFAVCIMDMRLPDMDGNAAIRLLHTLCPNMSFVIHTGSADYSLPRDLRTLGVTEDEVYLKPMADLAPLAESVRRLVSQHQMDPE
jgi:CheY-like chemotaxis protein